VNRGAVCGASDKSQTECVMNTVDNAAENVGYVAARGRSRKASVGLKNVVHRGFEGDELLGLFITTKH